MSKSPSSASCPPECSSSAPISVGSRVQLSVLYREGNILEMKRRANEQVTVIELEVPAATSSGDRWLLESTGGLQFYGLVDLDDISSKSPPPSSRQAIVHVKDAEVWCCRCCTDTSVPTPPFSLSFKGMTVRFCESNPHTIEAAILKIEKLENPTVTAVDLQATSLPPYYASMGDRIMVRSCLNSWEGTVMYCDDTQIRLDEVLENQISIRLLGEPQCPRCLPYTNILVRPAESGPTNFNIVKEGKRVSQRKRKSTALEKMPADQKRIKVAINGYRDIGRTLASVALDSEDVDLVAINDSSVRDPESCMFRDYKCDPQVLLFGEEVRFFKESDPRAVHWYEAQTEFVVTTSNAIKADEKDYESFISRNSKSPDPKLSVPLEDMVRTSASPVSILWRGELKPILAENRTLIPIISIKPISLSDAKAVSDWFPLWKGKPLASLVRYQKVDVIFSLDEYERYDLLLCSTKPSIDFRQLVRWCFHMVSRIPSAVVDVEMSKPSKYFKQ